MRFAQKLSIAIVLLLCITLSAGGAWTIQKNFDHALGAAEQQDAALHLRECYALETAFSRGESGTSAGQFEAARQYAEELRTASGSSNAPFTVFSETGTPVYSNMPPELPYMVQWNAVKAGKTAVSYNRAGEKAFLMMATPLRDQVQELWLVNAYDVTPLFDERDRQLGQYLVLESIALLLAGGAAVAVSILLTRPLRRMEAASRKIAAGAYDSRVRVTSQDELGQLGTAFNTMAGAVESHMEALQEESQRQKRFVGAFTHELKTPMTAILGYADVLRSGEQPAEKRQKAANYIYHESRRLEELSHALLLLLGLEHSGVTLVPVPLPAVLGDVRRSLPDSLPAELVTQCDAGLTVLADRTLLADLVRNLVLNAVNALPRDGRVLVCCERQPEGIRLSVRDKGQGIPEEDLKKVLEPFYRVDKSRARARGGNGLGLNLCAQIAELHGSRLEIQSMYGVGTDVSLLLKEARP